MHEARGVEQDIGLAGALGHGSDGSAIARVELCDFGDAFFLEVRELALVDIGGEHGRTLARKGQRTGAADSHRSRGYECALAFQAVRHDFLLFIFLASLRGAERRSNPRFRGGIDGLLRFVYHRARIRATRWLAMTAVGLMIIPRHADG